MGRRRGDTSRMDYSVAAVKLHELFTAAANAEPDGDAVGLLWQAFQEFARIEVEGILSADDDGDGLLVEYGTFDQFGPDGTVTKRFINSFQRQFMVDLGEDDAPIVQAGAVVQWEATDETKALGEGNLWSFGIDLDEFFAQAAALPGIAWGLGGDAEIVHLVIDLDYA